MGCQFSVVCCHMPSLTSAQSRASLDGAFSFALHHGPEVAPVFPQGENMDYLFPPRKERLNNFHHKNFRGLQRWLSNPPLFSANSSSPHFLAAASVSPWHSATSKEGHGASLLTTCSQTPTIDKHLLWRHPLRATLFALFRDPAALEGDDWESSARVPYLSSFNPLLRVTPPIQHIVCIPSKWACTPLGFTGIGTCLEFCMCSVLLCHN